MGGTISPLHLCAFIAQTGTTLHLLKTICAKYGDTFRTPQETVRTR